MEEKATPVAATTRSASAWPYKFNFMTNLEMKKLREENEASIDSSLKVDVRNVSHVVIENDRRTALFTVYQEDDHVVVVVVSSFGDWTAHLSGEKPFGLSEPELHLAFGAGDSFNADKCLRAIKQKLDVAKENGVIESIDPGWTAVNACPASSEEIEKVFTEMFWEDKKLFDRFVGPSRRFQFFLDLFWPAFIENIDKLKY